MGVWNDLVDSVLADYGTVKKTLFVVGGSKELQNAFIKSLCYQNESFLQPVIESPLANEFGLGYSFVQYRDDANELLSTLQIYTLQPHFDTTVLATTTSGLSAKDTIVASLLDYADDPHNWLRQAKATLIKFNEVFLAKDYKLLQVVTNKHRRFEWDPAVHEHIQLSLRTVGLLHDGSTLYVPDLARRSTRLVDLVSSLLELPIREGRVSVEPNLVDAAELLVPRGLDSWGKIRTLSEKIDPEDLAKSWSIDVEDDGFTETYESIVPEAGVSSRNVKKPSHNAQKKELENIPYQEFLNTLYDTRQRSKQR